jgi:hypothetical protein
MLTAIIPKLPMRDRAITHNYYVNKLGFKYIGSNDFEQYLIVERDNLQIHFFEFKTLDPKENYGQIYLRTDKIDELYKSMLGNNIEIHSNGDLENKPWQQREFSLLDPDNNLLTFGQDKY